MSKRNGVATESPAALLKRIVDLATESRYDLERLERMTEKYGVAEFGPISDTIAATVIAKIRGELKINAFENCPLGCEVTQKCA
jgi:hypothetical protein